MRRGDIVRVQLPRPQGNPGREQFGTRPAVLVQDSTAIANLGTVVVVPLTSKLKASQFRGSFVIHPTPHNGLTVDSVVLTHQLRAIDKSRIESVIGHIDADDEDQLNQELKAFLSL